MNNIYHRDIMDILMQRGVDGMKLCRIARKVYNKHADLFTKSINYNDIHKNIGSYLWKQSQKRESPFTRNSYGIYALKEDMAIQLDLFWDTVPDEETDLPETPKPQPPHLQLELF